jgi:phosphoglucomutase
VEVIDSVADYVSLMREIFDFNSLRDLFKGTEGRDPFRVLINSLNGGKLHVNIFQKEEKRTK